MRQPKQSEGNQTPSVHPSSFSRVITAIVVLAWVGLLVPLVRSGFTSDATPDLGETAQKESPLPTVVEPELQPKKKDPVRLTHFEGPPPVVPVTHTSNERPSGLESHPTQELDAPLDKPTPETPPEIAKTDPAPPVPIVSWSYAGRLDALVVVSGDLGPYQQALSGFRDNWPGNIQHVNLLSSNSADEEIRKGLSTKPQLVLAIGPAAASAVNKQHPTPDTPFFYAIVPNPETLRLPLNAIGIPDTASPSKQMETIRELMPQSQKIGLLFDPAQSRVAVDKIKTAAKENDFEVVAKEVHSDAEVSAAATEILSKVDLFLLVPDGTVIKAKPFKYMLQTSLEKKVPMVAFAASMTKAGAVMSLSVDYKDIGKKAAELGKQLLSGESVHNEFPITEVSINTKSASRCALTIPDSLKESASHIYY